MQVKYIIQEKQNGKFLPLYQERERHFATYPEALAAAEAWVKWIDTEGLMITAFNAHCNDCPNCNHYAQPQKG